MTTYDNISQKDLPQVNGGSEKVLTPEEPKNEFKFPKEKDLKLKDFSCRKSVPDIQKSGFQSFLAKIRPKSSKSSYEMRDKKSPEEEEKLKDDERIVLDEQKGEEVEDTQIVSQKTHSTPTSGFDDGYGSCNSSPHGSGKSN